MHLSPCHQDALLHLTGSRGLSAAALLNTVCADPACLEVKSHGPSDGVQLN